MNTQSQTDLLDDQALAPLFRWIAASCQKAFTEIGWDFSLATPSFNNAWAMVNGPGHTTRAHLHPHSLFSGVVYLRADEGAELRCFAHHCVLARESCCRGGFGANLRLG